MASRKRLRRDFKVERRSNWGPPPTLDEVEVHLSEEEMEAFLSEQESLKVWHIPADTV